MRALLALWWGLVGCRFGFDEQPTASVDAAIDARPGDAMPPGAVLALHFEEGSGGTTTAEDGTVAMMLDATWTTGVRGGAVQLASTGYIDLPVAADLVLRGAFTASAWYRLDATTPCMVIVIHGGLSDASPANNTMYGLSLTPPSVQLYSEYADQQMNMSVAGAPANAFSLDTWHHVAVVRDASQNITFYFDGVTSFPDSMPMPASDGEGGHLRIGNDIDDATGCGPPPGRIDEVYIYPRALTAAEVQAL